MAETVHLFLKANNQQVAGESTQVSLGRDGSIECVSFESTVNTSSDFSTALSSSRREYQPIKIAKRIDKATPYIARALTQNQVVEGKFLFFRPNPRGDGTTEQFFSVEFNDGRIQSIRLISPNVADPALRNLPPMEEITLVFNRIVWTYSDGGITHEDSWRDNR